MNEQINDLMYHAGLTAQGCWDSMDDYDQEAILKFAELIVRECMDIAREVGTSTEPEDFALDRCYEIETKIKEHFGVEE